MSIRIVLVRASHPGNIGSAARAMKNMGLGDLCLVAPERFPAPRPRRWPPAPTTCWTAPGSFPTCRGGRRLRAGGRHDRALPGTCRGACSSRARPRREIAAAAASGPVAVLFGAERTGLTNEELELCQRLRARSRPAPTYASLNLAMAVQVLAYEILLATRAAAPSTASAAASRSRAPSRWSASTRTSSR